jgi:hypothetical protein
MTEPFVSELCQYISDNSDFAFGEGLTELKVGELIKDTEGIFATQGVSPEADKDLPMERYVIDFWALYTDSLNAFTRLRAIYNLLHQRHSYVLNSFVVQYSYALNQIQDMGKDAEDKKILRLSIAFNSLNIIS